jgi:integrase
MRIAVYPVADYDAVDRRSKKSYRAWRVNWRVYPPDGAEPRNRKRGGFRRKGEAEAFADRLRKAEHGTDGWRLDAHDLPTRDEPVPARRDTVFDLTSAYVKAKWRGWSENQREKACPRLNDARRILVEGTPPANVDEYLRTISLCGPVEPGDDELDSRLAEGRRWLRRHSTRLDWLNQEQLQLIVEHFTDGHLYSTARTYWTVVDGCVTWGLTTGMLNSDPRVGLVGIKRDTALEEVDPERIPTLNEIWRIADACAAFGGPQSRALPLVLGFGALRIGEACGLERRDVCRAANGGAWVTVRTNFARTSKRYSDTGSTSTLRAPKGRTSGPGARRKTYLPPEVADVLFDHLKQYVASDPTSPVFNGKRGGRLCSDTHREHVWKPACGSLFPAGHRLVGLRRHDLRHAAMTMWLQMRLNLAQCQKWGGWKSLKVMLDTYAHVMPNSEEDAADQVKGYLDSRTPERPEDQAA